MLRIVTGELEALVHAVRADQLDAHDVRKSTKRLRALVRLFRAALPAAARNQQMGRLRALAHAFDPAREAAVVAAQADAIGGDAAFGALAARRALARALRTRARDLRRVGARRDVLVVATALASELLQSRRTWSAIPDGWRGVGRGIERLYRRAREAGRRAAHRPSTERLHEWRKRTQDLRFAAAFLEQASPSVLRPLAHDLHRLADLLGEDHDLAMLRGHIRAVAPNGRIPPAAAAAIRRRRVKLQMRARRRGMLVDPPRLFRRRLRDAWRTVSAAS